MENIKYNKAREHIEKTKNTENPNAKRSSQKGPKSKNNMNIYKEKDKFIKNLHRTRAHSCLQLGVGQTTGSIRDLASDGHLNGGQLPISVN